MEFDSQGTAGRNLSQWYMDICIAFQLSIANPPAPLMRTWSPAHCCGCSPFTLSLPSFILHHGNMQVISFYHWEKSACKGRQENILSCVHPLLFSHVKGGEGEEQSAIYF